MRRQPAHGLDEHGHDGHDARADERILVLPVLLLDRLVAWLIEQALALGYGPSPCSRGRMSTRYSSRYEAISWVLALVGDAHLAS